MDNTYSKTEIDGKLDNLKLSTEQYFNRTLIEFQHIDAQFKLVNNNIDWLKGLLFASLITLIVTFIGGAYLAVASGLFSK